MRYFSEGLIDREAAVKLMEGVATEKEQLHDHDFWELVYISGGRGLQTVDGGEYTVCHGDLLLMREGQRHTFCGEPQFSYINLCIDPRLLLRDGSAPSAAAELFWRVSLCDILSRGGCLIHFGEQERGRIEPLLATMFAEQRGRRLDWQQIQRRYLDVFFLTVLRALKERESGEKPSDVWESLCAYIDNNLSADLSLTALAARLFYHPAYLSRTFSAHFGCGISAHVASRRAARAASLAKTGQYTVEHLAYESGFSSKSALYRAFRKHRGEELGEFLERCKKTNL